MVIADLLVIALRKTQDLEKLADAVAYEDSIVIAMCECARDLGHTPAPEEYRERVRVYLKDRRRDHGA